MAQVADHELVSLVRRHRQRWPLVRIAADPARYRAECQQLLNLFPAHAADPPLPDSLSGSWLNLMLTDPRHHRGSKQPLPRDA